MPIAALSQDTVGVLTSSVALNDALSVVKELLDNALDAGATAITIEISNNTIDVIQVKDNGIGIGIEDRQLLCKKSCTSKIRSIQDLTTLGGRSLGFRGEALASTANISHAVIITTRIEGEPVGTALKFGANGKMLSSSSAAHAVGTTVRVQDLLSNVPVRKQTVLKSTLKTLSNIRKLLFAYSFARPEVRFIFKVLKAKNNKLNWSCAPSKATSTLLEDISKVIGKDAAAQLVPRTTTSSEGIDHQYTLEALLINPESGEVSRARSNSTLIMEDIGKACNIDSYFCVDQRPVSADRDLMKEMQKLYKKYLRNALPPTIHDAISKPFMCLRLLCAPESYDINVEPAKDRVLFYHESQISELFEQMLRSIYGELASTTTPSRPQLSSSTEADSFNMLLSRPRQTPTSQSEPNEPSVKSSETTTLPRATLEQFAGRTTSHEIDDDCGQPLLDNPWIKAKMNVRISQTTDLNAENLHSPSEISLNPPRRPAPALDTFNASPKIALEAAQDPATVGIAQGHGERYQNPGPPIRRRGPHVSDSESDSPPSSTQDGSTLLEEWIKASQQVQPRQLLNSSPSASELSRVEGCGEPLNLCTPGSTPGHEVLEVSQQRCTPSTRFQQPISGGLIQQKLFVPPFTTPRPGQSQSGTASSQTVNVLSHFESQPVQSHTPSSVHRRLEKELDEIMEFERRKKAIAQQRKLTKRAVNTHSSESTRVEMIDGPLSEPRQDHEESSSHDLRNEDFESQFSVNDNDDKVDERPQGLQQISDRVMPRPAMPLLRFVGRRDSPSAGPADLSAGDFTKLNETAKYLKMADTDPRSRLIRQKDAEHQVRGAVKDGHTRTGLIMHRVKTSRLPLEIIQRGMELHNLSVDLPGEAQHDSGMFCPMLNAQVLQLQELDEYIKSGETRMVNWTTHKQDIPEWNRVLVNALKMVYPLPHGGNIDLTSSLNHAFKA